MDIDALKAKGDAALAQISNALDDLQYSPDQRPVPILHLAMDYVHDMLALLSSRQEVAPVAYCDPSDPRNSHAFAWPGTFREERHATPLYTSTDQTSDARDVPSRETLAGLLAAMYYAQWATHDDKKRIESGIESALKNFNIGLNRFEESSHD